MAIRSYKRKIQESKTKYPCCICGKPDLIGSGGIIVVGTGENVHYGGCHQRLKRGKKLKSQNYMDYADEQVMEEVRLTIPHAVAVIKQIGKTDFKQFTNQEIEGVFTTYLQEFMNVTNWAIPGMSKLDERDIDNIKESIGAAVWYMTTNQAFDFAQMTMEQIEAVFTHAACSFINKDKAHTIPF